MVLGKAYYCLKCLPTTIMVLGVFCLVCFSVYNFCINFYHCTFYLCKLFVLYLREIGIFS